MHFLGYELQRRVNRSLFSSSHLCLGQRSVIFQGVAYALGDYEFQCLAQCVEKSYRSLCFRIRIIFLVWFPQQYRGGFLEVRRLHAFAETPLEQ